MCAWLWDSLEFGPVARSHSRCPGCWSPWAEEAHCNLSAGCWPEHQTWRAREPSADCEPPLRGQTTKVIISVYKMTRNSALYCTGNLSWPFILSTTVMIWISARRRAMSSNGLPSFRLYFFPSAFLRFLEDLLLRTLIQSNPHDQAVWRYLSKLVHVLWCHSRWNARVTVGVLWAKTAAGQDAAGLGEEFSVCAVRTLLICNKTDTNRKRFSNLLTCDCRKK